MCRRFHCPFPSVLFAALSVRLLVNLALDPGAGKVPEDYGAYLRFIKQKGAEIYYNTTMALPYQIDPEQIDDALEPLELQALLKVLTADADYLVY